MDEDAPAPRTGTEPAVVVEVTPRSYRRQSIVFVAAGLLLTGLALWLRTLHGRFDVDPLLGLASIAYGVYCAVQARRRTTRTLLRIDRSGIRSDDGRYDQTWSGVVMVWVGSATGLRLPLVASPVISVYTDAGLDFARRAGTRPKARHTVPLALPWTVRRLCEELRRVTDAAVVDGTATSRAAAATALQGSTRD